MLAAEAEKRWSPLDGPVPDDGFAPEQWGPEWAAKRLVEALEVSVIECRVGPKHLQAQKIDYSYTREDIQGWEHGGDDSWRNRIIQEWGRKRRRPSNIEIQLADEAMHWPIRYLKDQGGPARCLQLWLIAKVGHRNINRMLKQKHINVSTFRRQRMRALELIAQGLIRDGVAVR